LGCGRKDQPVQVPPGKLVERVPKMDPKTFKLELPKGQKPPE
jgi:hypothetical protein